jgi:hypothetical protein
LAGKVKPAKTVAHGAKRADSKSRMLDFRCRTADCSNPADLNCDGSVNFADVHIFSLQWLHTVP